jgi:hypothetical protein
MPWRGISTTRPAGRSTISRWRWAGLRVFDAAVGGLGGCPYAPGAAGNVATEAVAARLAALGYETGLDMGVIARGADGAGHARGRHG